MRISFPEDPKEELEVTHFILEAPYEDPCDINLIFKSPTNRRVFLSRVTIQSPDEAIAKLRRSLHETKLKGFDNVKPPHEWRGVWIELRLPSTTEHAFAWMPETWDPDMCLNVMARVQVAEGQR